MLYYLSIIRDVWSSNLEEEFENIIQLVSNNTYVSLDTEFPGCILSPKNVSDPFQYVYQKIKLNCDILKIIQIGLTLSDSLGNIFQTWQFNFNFNIKIDQGNEDSLELLINSGIDFDNLINNGIDPKNFGELLTVSGLLCNDKIIWITFHSGYDFGYLIKILLGINLPETRIEFTQILSEFFPVMFDVKYIMSYTPYFGGLSDLANELGIHRVGPRHQAGSDALLTIKVFFELLFSFFMNSLDYSFSGKIYGLGDDTTGFPNARSISFSGFDISQEFL